MTGCFVTSAFCCTAYKRFWFPRLWGKIQCCWLHFPSSLTKHALNFLLHLPHEFFLSQIFVSLFHWPVDSRLTLVVLIFYLNENTSTCLCILIHSVSLSTPILIHSVSSSTPYPHPLRIIKFSFLLLSCTFHHFIAYFIRNLSRCSFQTSNHLLHPDSTLLYPDFTHFTHSTLTPIWLCPLRSDSVYSHVTPPSPIQHCNFTSSILTMDGDRDDV